MNDQQLGQRAADFANEFDYEGISILQVAAEALLQSGFTDEAEVLEQMVSKLERTDETPIYILEIKDK